MQTTKLSIIKQNKKIVVIVVTIMTMLLTSIPAFGYTDNSINNVNFGLTLPVSSNPVEGIAVSVAGGKTFYISSGGSTSVYLSYYFNSSNPTSSTNGELLCMSDETFTVYRKVNSNTYHDTASYNGTYYVYEYSAFSIPFNQTNLNIPIFTTPKTNAYESFESFLDEQESSGSGGITESPKPLNITIQPGYVLYANVENIDTVRYVVGTTTNIAVLPSVMLANNQYYGFADSIPSGDFTLPLNGSTSFPWNTQKTNIYGKGTNWQALGTLNPTGKYIFIINPLVSTYRLSGINGNTEIVEDATVNNGNIVVTLTNVNTSDVKLIPLNASYVYDPANGVEGINQGGNGESPYNVTFDENGNPIYTDQNGNVVNPPSGGNTDTSVPTMFGTITAWLENIAQQISGFFTGAVGAISTLISAGSAFVTQLSGLYSWLPPQVYSVLISGLILVITVGVIKVFL